MSAPQDSEFLGHEPCPSCGSSDALAVYSDGHRFCFAQGCGYYDPGDGEDRPRTRRKAKMAADLISDGEVKPITKRGITEETCKKFNYRIGKMSGQTVHIAPYYDADGNIVAQHIRTKTKDFPWLGRKKDALLFGQHLWRDGGRRVVVTEGEIDCMSISQLQDNRWPVVSIKSGASGAKKDIAQHLDWLEQFDEVVFAFDMDEPGRAAAQECALLLTPGKGKIASYDLKDANEMLQAQRGRELLDALWGAKSYRPDGIVAGDELWGTLVNPEYKAAVPYPWEGLNDKTRGLRLGELVTFTAGSGIGKTTAIREIEAHLIRLGETVGIIHLEESVRKAALGLMSIYLNQPLHLRDEENSLDTDEVREAYMATVGSGRVFLYDHFGSMQSDNLLAKIRYLARGCDCKWIFLDHLSIVISGQDDGDERRLIDNTMTQLRSLVEELNIGLILVSHLKRPEGKGHEEGARTSLAQLRGSAAIGQLSDMVIGLERNQQDPTNSDLTSLRVLKNRFSGETGEAGTLHYDKQTGRMEEVDPEFAEAGTEETPF